MNPMASMNRMSHSLQENPFRRIRAALAVPPAFLGNNPCSRSAKGGYLLARSLFCHKSGVQGEPNEDNSGRSGQPSGKSYSQDSCMGRRRSSTRAWSFLYSSLFCWFSPSGKKTPVELLRQRKSGRRYRPPTILESPCLRALKIGLEKPENL